MKHKLLIVDDSNVSRLMIRGALCDPATRLHCKRVCRRPRDLVARYGGEELAVILPDTHAAGADQALYAAKNDGRDRVFCLDTARQMAVEA